MGEIELLVGGVSGMSLGGRSGRSRRLVANCKAFCWVGEVDVALLVLLTIVDEITGKTQGLFL